MIISEQKDLAYYRLMFFISDEDSDNVRRAGEQVSQEKEAFYLEFYKILSEHRIFKPYLNHDVLLAIKDCEDIFWDDLILGEFSDDYLDRQRYFGKMFATVGIPFEAYLAMLSTYHEYARRIFERNNLATSEFLLSFHKLACVSIAIVMDGYNTAMSNMIADKNSIVMEMSSPIAQLWDGISLLPLVGFIDSTRAQTVMTAILQDILKTQPRIFIVDISGVAAMDTAVANYLIKITKATRLMGCTCMLSGISPVVAQTIVELGVQIDEIITTGTMKNAFRKALELLEKKK
jgi:rsbT co-antagonist protein RsbR